MSHDILLTIYFVYIRHNYKIMLLRKKWIQNTPNNNDRFLCPTLTTPALCLRYSFLSCLQKNNKTPFLIHWF